MKKEKRQMKQNLGKTDRILRFLLAFWWLGPWALRTNIQWVNWIIVIVAWIALLESFTGYCWLHRVLGINNRSN